jgi:hypothetical protein
MQLLDIAKRPEFLSDTVHLYVLPLQTVTGGLLVHVDCSARIEEPDNAPADFFDGGLLVDVYAFLGHYENILLYGADGALKRWCEVSTISLHMSMEEQTYVMTDRAKAIVRFERTKSIGDAMTLVNILARDYAGTNVAYWAGEASWEQCEERWDMATDALSDIKDAFDDLHEKRDIVGFFWRQKERHETEILKSQTPDDNDDDDDDDDRDWLEYDDDDDDDDDDDNDDDDDDDDDDVSIPPILIKGLDGHMYDKADLCFEAERIGRREAQIEEALKTLPALRLDLARMLLVNAREMGKHQLNAMKINHLFRVAKDIQDTYTYAKETETKHQLATRNSEIPF